jgi:exonuclease SbcC
MRPLKLSMTAFGPYAATETVDFRRATDAGLFGIYGPTGSGKSSIFSAMAFALFGEGAKHEQPSSSMRSDHAAADTLTEVSFIFELGDKRYFVRRQPDQMRPKVNGDGETKSAHTAFLFDVSDLEIDDVTVDNCGRVMAERRVGPVNECIRGLLGYDVDQFRQIVLLPQGQFERFLASDSKDRLTILRGLFDVSLYERMTERLKLQAAEARTAYQQGMALHVQQLATAGFTSTDDLTSAIDSADSLCTELDQSAMKTNAVHAGALKALGDGEALQKCFDEASAAVTALTELQKRQVAMDSVRARHRAADRALQLVDRDDAVTRVADTLASAREAEAAAGRSLAEAQAAEAASIKTLGDLKAKAGEIDGLKGQLSDLDRFSAILSNATDLKIRAELAEGTFTKAQVAAQTAHQIADSAVKALASHRAHVDLAQANNSQRFQLTAQRDQVQQQARHASVVERARSALKSAEEALAGALPRAANARSRVDGLETMVRTRQSEFIAGQARLLAESLESGSPCPVCGSADHPQPAHGGEPVAGLEDAWRAAQSEFELAAQESAAAELAVGTAKSVRDERKKALAELEEPKGASADLQRGVVRLNTAIENLGDAADITALGAQTVQLDATVAATDLDRVATATAAQSASSAAALARQAYNDHIAGVPDQLRDLSALELLRKTVTQQVDLRSQEIDAAQDACVKKAAERAGAASAQAAAVARIAECDKALANAREAYSTKRDELGLSDEQYRTAKADIGIMAALVQELDAYRENLTRAQTRVESSNAAVEGHEKPDIDALRSARDAAQTAAQAAGRAAADAGAKRNQLRQLLESLREQMERLALLNEKSGPLRALADAIEGRNTMNITLETYAVGAMFDQVLESANLRFGPMSQGRYRLERDVQTIGGKRKRGLDIRVHDIQTGRAREVSTLSGGETFIAALSLALGLADIVEMSHGAIRLDTIFIDEGFGSLDSDGDGGTLDQVLQVLLDIVGANRAVGLISHVPLVQQAVPNGFTVIKTPSGSRIEERIA